MARWCIWVATLALRSCIGVLCLRSGLVPMVLSRYRVRWGDFRRGSILDRLMALSPCASHHPGAGTVSNLSLPGALATGPGRIALSGLLPRAIASTALGAAGLAWSHG